MKTNQVIQLAGSASALAAILGVSRAAVSQWGEEVPELRQYQLMKLRPKWFRKGRQLASVAEQQSTAAVHH